MNNKNEWDQFIIEQGGSFLQSWQWGEFQKSLGHDIWRIEKQGLKGLLIKHNLPFKKSYLYCPKGPVGQGDLKSFFNEVEDIRRKQGSIFFKIEPEYKHILKDFNFIKSQKEIQPSKTIILDIRKIEEDLLKEMHSKTRYNIRLSQKKGLKIEESINQGSLEAFFKLLSKTAARDKFFLHPKSHYVKMLDILSREEMVKLFLAKYKGKVIAGILVGFFNKTAIYFHGASDYKRRNLMAPYLLQWHSILEAKDHNIEYYDFWGINEKKWPGVTRFKKGFGGKEIIYPGSFDMIFNPAWYGIYNLVRKIL